MDEGEAQVRLDLVRASIDNLETDKYLARWGYHYDEARKWCATNLWCRIYNHRANAEVGECMDSLEYNQIEDLILESDLPVGEELVAVLG